MTEGWLAEAPGGVGSSGRRDLGFRVRLTSVPGPDCAARSSLPQRLDARGFHLLISHPFAGFPLGEAQRPGARPKQGPG